MKKLLVISLILLAGCGQPLTDGQRAAITTGETLASAAVQAAATVYGGPAAGELAAAGLSAVASVLQGYVGNPKPDVTVITASPGVKGIGPVVIKYLESKNVITQATVDKIHMAATIAADQTLP